MAVTLPNRLASEKSPYLLQHALNPVDWFPWGEEAFARARREDKPIFLSIGYSTCHWCHVMEHESFESPEIAALLNAHFVSIKVDREERPDVDQVYMLFVQATTGHGGWPMSVWLTPELRPFFGGTYFPPTDVPGRAGFRGVLGRIAELWQSDRPQIEEKAHSLLAALRESAGGAEAGKLATGEAVRTCLAQYSRMFDPQEGGFGNAPKFPRPVNLEFLLGLAATSSTPVKDAELARGMAFHTLRKMAAGGMHDHLGGGFHRYSVDGEWHVPHFEKMLYDQGQLAQVYLTAWQLGGEALFAHTAKNIFQYVEHDLTDSAGGFYSAEDADSLPAAGAKRKLEGAFYAWRAEEIHEVLGEDRVAEFDAVYGIEPEGNVAPQSDPHGELAGLNVLIRRLSLEAAARHFDRPVAVMEQRLHDDHSALLASRGLRPRPHLDDKIVTAWNGLMIGAFARGGALLGEGKLLHTAQRAAVFVRDHLYDAGTGLLSRSYRQGAGTVAGFASDYAFLTAGLLDLYQADFDLQWLRWARQLQQTMDTLFWDETHGGYFSSHGNDPAILLRLREDYDGAEPTPSSVAALNLWRLGQWLHDEALLERARRTVESFAAQLELQPFAMPLLLSAAMLLETAPVHLVLHSAEASDPARAEFLRVAHSRYLPNLVLISISDPAAREFFAPHHPVIAGLPEKPERPTAYLCENFACQLPVTDPDALRKMLANL